MSKKSQALDKQDFLESQPRQRVRESEAYET